MPDLLARFAENSFWLARYMERAENLARILDVNETFAQDSRGVKEWLPIVELHTDDARFFARHGAATADAVIHFYVLDRDNPSSIIAGVRTARENARALRHLISTEMWAHINVFYNRLQELGPDDLKLSRLSRLCATIKEDCQLHTGITEGTMYRDQGWSFYQLGKSIERADQTTRLLDINYHRLTAQTEAEAASADASGWNAVLRSAAGYHAFRRVHPRGMRPEAVADFLLFDPAFPRSVSSCLAQIDSVFRGLVSRPELCHLSPASQSLETLNAMVGENRIEQVLGSGMHDFLDSVQLHLIGLTDELAHAFFGHRQ